MQGKLLHTLKRLGGYVIATIALVVLWALCSKFIASPALPMPGTALKQFIEQLPELLPQAGVSCARVIAAMVIGTALGLPLGLFVGRSKKVDTVMAPLLYLLYPIPKVVFLPVLLVLLGLGNAPKVVLIALVIFFQTMMTARDSARSIPEASVMSVRSLGARKRDIAFEVVLPASLPDVFTALRINTGTAIAILFLSESIAGSSGLGYYIVNAWGMIDYPSMFGGIIAMALMGVVLYELINVLEARLTRWRRA